MFQYFAFVLFHKKQEAQGLGTLLDKMADNDRIKLANIEIYNVGVCFALRPAVFETQGC